MSSRREKRGFTLIELVVAVGLLAMIFSFSGVIFKVCIKSHRMAVANAEIMQKFRVITDQINADFKGLRKDAPLVIHWDKRGGDRDDKIMFFADGDFQSAQPYWDYGPGIGKAPGLSGQQIRGNVARICYALAMQPNGIGGWIPASNQSNPKRRILARKQNILTADVNIDRWPDVTIPDVNYSFLREPSQYPPTEENRCRERYEHDSLSLSQWMSLPIYPWNDSVLQQFIKESPRVNLNDPNTLHKLWSEGVSDFAVEWAYRDDSGVLCWYPSDNPDGMGNFPSHFLIDPQQGSHFGVFFYMPGNVRLPEIFHVGQLPYSTTNGFSPNFYPDALRFTFTIHDSKGVYAEGRIFTHIVYLGDRVEN